MQALAHLGATVVDEDRAVLVDVHERAALVERAVRLNEIPNLTGVTPMARLVSSLAALNRAISPADG